MQEETEEITRPGSRAAGGRWLIILGVLGSIAAVGGVLVWRDLSAPERSVAEAKATMEQLAPIGFPKAELLQRLDQRRDIGYIPAEKSDAVEVWMPPKYTSKLQWRINLWWHGSHGEPGTNHIPFTVIFSSDRVSGVRLGTS